MPTAAITSEPLLEYQDGTHVRMLRAAGFEVIHPPKLPLKSEDETIEALQGVAAVVAGSDPFTERVLTSLPELRIISRVGVGCDQIDLDAARRHGVAVAITPLGNWEGDAEHAMALLLAAARSIVQNQLEVRRGVWGKPRLMPLRGRTLGLVGLGRTGRGVAVRAQAFGMHLVGSDPLADESVAHHYGIELVDFGSLLARSDFISLHLPLTAETKGLINRAALAQMQRGATLINTSRGGLIVESELVEALRSGHIAAAGLDVLVDEPPGPDNPLLAMDNVVISPHVAGNDTQSIVDMADGAAQNIVNLFRGDEANCSLVVPGGKR